jgi:GNAT superfamily N-acetyltransferase
LSTTITTTAVIPANITTAPTYVGTLKLKKETLPGLIKPSLIEDTFTKIPPSNRALSLRIDPLFHSLHLTPGIATEKDIPELLRLNMEHIKEIGGTAFIKQQLLALQQRTPEEQSAYTKKKLGMGMTAEQHIKFLQNLSSASPEVFSFLMNAGDDLGKKEALATATPLLKKRFIDNPQGAYLVLKNTEKKIVATAAFNQFQNTHDFDMNMDNMKGLDPKHALETAVYVAPEYRKKGLATALRKTLIDLAHQKGIAYLWSPTEAGTSSQRIMKNWAIKSSFQKLRFQTLPLLPLRRSNNYSKSTTWVPVNWHG